MYTVCLFCTSHLPRNELLETFPVGRRLAFDAARGRLWVICPRCERWNLSPLEERWAAIDDCERQFRDTKLRASSGEIGLARVRDESGAIDLVRVGRPLRPEFAAWRYGDQFGRRRRRAIATSALAAGAIGGALVVAPMLGVAAAVVASSLAIGANAVLVASIQRGTVRLEHPDGGYAVVDANVRANARLVRAPQTGWGLEIPYIFHERDGVPWWKTGKGLLRPNGLEAGRLRVEGAAASRALALLMPRINGRGASTGRVVEATALIEASGAPDRFFHATAARLPELAAQQSFGDNGALSFMPRTIRLALEMAAHEETERRALAGELALLEAAWRNAEEVAGIADRL